MVQRAQYEELARQLSDVDVVKRDIQRILPSDCAAGPSAVLTLLGRHGDMCVSELAEMLAVDMAVTSRHVAYVAARGWIERLPESQAGPSRTLRLTPAGMCRLEDLSRRFTNLVAERLSQWTDDEVGQLISLMNRLHASFG
ncbi:MarR family transcriptional regulator [Streptomyces sp. VRA16 Mangrove soil]|nr:MarR family transcriptional regulator [Streptomyces sp. VRA16 Mangrove soil]